MVSSILTSKTVAFSFSIILVCVIWWLIQRSKRQVNAVLYGLSSNPYIANIVSGIKKECERQGACLNLVLFEDISGSVGAYEAALRLADTEPVICRMHPSVNAQSLAASGKKLITISWNETDESAREGHAKVVDPPTYAFEDDAVVVVPVPDFPKVHTNGAVIAASNLNEKQLDAVVSLAKLYDLSSLYIFGDLPGFSDERVQASLRSVFTKIRVLPIPGQEEGERAVREYMGLFSKGFGLI